MAADNTSIAASLKETFTEERLAEQFYNQNPFYQRIKKLKNTKVGKGARTPIETSLPGGFSALPASGGQLNSAGHTGMDEAEWQYKHFYQPVEIESAAIDASSSDTLAVADVIDTEVSNGLAAMNREFTRMLFLSGDALIATCGTTSTAAEVELDATTGFNAIERGWLRPGQIVDIGTSADEDNKVGSAVISAVEEDDSTPSITIGSSISTTSSDFVSIANARAGTTSNESNGLGNIVSGSATLGSVTVASQPQWASDVDSTSQALTLALMLARARKVHQKTGKRPDYVLTSLKQEENFYKLLQTQVRFAGDSVAAGDVNPKWQGMEINAQPDCQNERMYFLTIGDYFIVSGGDPYWQNRHDSGSILQWKQGYTSYVATLMARLNVGVRRRNSSTALTGLS
jgi:hypothetical protein